METPAVYEAATTAQRYRKNNLKRQYLLAIGFLLLLLSVLADVVTGPGSFSVSTVLDVVLGLGNSSPQAQIIIWDIRLPTALLALLVGAMLGAAGAEMQTILNNPLADPFTLGISSASSFGAALAIVLGGSLGLELFPLLSDGLVTVSAFGFALLTSCSLYFLIRRRGASSETMVLVGIALLFTFNALLSLLQYSATDVQLSQIVFWMMGSLSKANWLSVSVCSVVVLLVVPLFLYRSWALTALRMGDEKAESLGVDTRRVRIEMLLCISLLTATAVSFVGTIAFVGLVGPHIARMLVGEDQRFFLPMSLISGALIMSLTSLVSKSVTDGVVYPVGIITSLVGIPFFISLILGSQRRRWN
ncbi:iron ABC transporter permease [Aestuariirhabdus sp. Z084]|uniref:FecCD family ABC transporter permease n=1 Tax=Aestuariirhabdus haliotis TaxID=2918751 RepID=UPI00201B3561|nr:iron ABC transporter permease [Aestuariirhabdus haliotis]MCL6417611.1 iron ABC transporter permease [Aestuariirhabdus haliotis]MCL6421537.1 iron ABC transporter permease [Aestuariirhabdus haliotis]